MNEIEKKKLYDSLNWGDEEKRLKNNHIRIMYVDEKIVFFLFKYINSNGVVRFIHFDADIEYYSDSSRVCLNKCSTTKYEYKALAIVEYALNFFGSEGFFKQKDKKTLIGYILNEQDFGA
jgi:hypothetical protein